MKPISVKIIVSGVVQGVFYRAYTEKKGKELSLFGTVRNLPDGSVEIFAQGEETKIEALKKWCWEGSPHSRVSGVVDQEIELSEKLPPFRIVY